MQYMRAGRWYPETCQYGVTHFSGKGTGYQRVTKDLSI